eukprot:scaffold43341_cov34-Phaeocystis_antarctica.AAC.1
MLTQKSVTVRNRQICGGGSLLGQNGTASTLNTYAITRNRLENRVDVPCISIVPTNAMHHSV